MKQNSNCIAGRLHDYQIVKEFSSGVLERCDKCKTQKFFKTTTPNYIYLSWHMKMFLQLKDKRFYKENPNYIK